MKVKDIAALIEAVAPLSLQEEYDNSGLNVGSPEQEVTGILLCVDVTDETVDEALRRSRCPATHRRPLHHFGHFALCGPHQPRQRARRTEFHTRQRIGIERYADARPALCGRRSVRLRRRGLALHDALPICSGASFIDDAIAAGADLYMAADFKYNDFYRPDGRIVIADVGHFESEYCAMALLYDIITKKFANFAVHRSERSVNPVNYSV